MLRKRIAAFLIDFLIINICNAILQYVFIFPLMRQTEPLIELINSRRILILLISLVLLIFRDMIGTRSPGKKILELNIIDLETNKVANFSKRFLRNITLPIAPIEILLLTLGKQSIGGYLSNTTITDDFVYNNYLI